jgi:hypothetical protein
MIDTKRTEQAGAFPKSVTSRECSDTGMAMVLICLLAGWFTGIRDWFLGAIILLIINMTWPTIYTWAAKGWLGFSHLLGTVMSKIILSLIFFIVVTPLALLRRALGHDPMALKKWKKGTESVFETRDHTYTPEEIEQPF